MNVHTVTCYQTELLYSLKVEKHNVLFQHIRNYNFSPSYNINLCQYLLYRTIHVHTRLMQVEIRHGTKCASTAEFCLHAACVRRAISPLAPCRHIQSPHISVIRTSQYRRRYVRAYVSLIHPWTNKGEALELTQWRLPYIPEDPLLVRDLVGHFVRSRAFRRLYRKIDRIEGKIEG